MRIEIEEHNVEEAAKSEQPKLIGSKSDIIWLRVFDVPNDCEVHVSIMQIEEDGSEVSIASSETSDGPPLELRRLDTSPDQSVYLLRLLYQSISGRKLRVTCGGQRAETIVWHWQGYSIEERQGDCGPQWYVFDRAKQADHAHSHRDSYALCYRGVIGPYSSKMEAQKYLLMFALHALSEAVLHNSDADHWRARAEDALLAVKL